MGFIEWISGAVEFIIAPFRKVAEVVGGVLDGIGGFFKGLIGGSDGAGKALEDNLTKTAAGGTGLVKPVVSVPKAAGDVAGKPVKPDFLEGLNTKGTAAPDFGTRLAGGLFGGKAETPSAVAEPGLATPRVSGGMPDMRGLPAPSAAVPTAATPAVFAGMPDMQALPVPGAAVPAAATPTVPTPSVSGGSGMDAQEQSVSIPAKRMNGVSASSVTRRVSGAFASAMDASVAIPAATPAMPIPTVTQGAVTPPDIAVTATPTVPMPDMSAVKEKAASIPGAAGAKRGSLETPWKQAKEEKNASPASITIQNAYFQAEDCTTLFDFMRMIMHVTHNPQEAAI